MNERDYAVALDLAEQTVEIDQSQWGAILRLENPMGWPATAMLLAEALLVTRKMLDKAVLGEGE